MAAHSGTLSKLLSIGRRADSHFDRRIALLALLSLIAAGIEIAVLGSIVPVLALVAKRSPSNVSLSTIFGGDPLSIVLLFAGLVLGAAVARLALAAAIQRGVLKIGHAINTAIQRRLLYQPYLFHVSSNSSRFVAALQKADQLAFGVLGPLIQGAAGVIIGLAILAFLLMTVDWRVTAGACVVLGGSYFVMSRYAASRLVERGGAAVTAYEDQIKLMMESSGAIRDVLLDHRQQAFADVFERASMRMAKAREGTDLLNYAPRFMVEAVGAIAIAGLAVFIALREGGIAGSLPMFGLLALAMVRIVPLAQSAYRGWTMLPTQKRAIDDVEDFLQLPVPSSDGPPPAPLLFKKRLAVEDISFAYPGASRPVLEHANLTVERGEWLGLTGATGSGKSTLGDLIMGFLTPDAGEIAIDGETLTRDRIPHWQRSIAHVSQAVYLLDDSVGANIALVPAGAKSDRRLAGQCAEIAQLDRWINELPDGLDTIVGEQGGKLSGGQKQRVGIARALYKQSDFLVLDEATNALDAETEAALLDAVRQARPGITVLMISHRATALQRCDRVLKVEGGRLAPA